MNIDRLNQKLILQDGRTLGFAEYGDPNGLVVLNFHGGAGSRLERPADESILAELGIRYISTDRPGHGLSTVQTDRKLLDWPEDIQQLVDHLGIQIFHVLGWSAAGPHALACAYKLPKRVLACAIVSGYAPPDRPRPYLGYSLPNRLLLYVFRRMPKLVYAFRRGGYNTMQGNPLELGKKLLSSLPPADKDLFEIPDYQSMFIADIQEGYLQGGDGPALDDILINKPWGFRLEDIVPRIDVWQGEVDQNVPLNQGQYLHKKIPNSRLTILENQAHLYLLSHWRTILSALVE